MRPHREYDGLGMARRIRYIASGLAAIILMPVATHLAHNKSDDYADAATAASQQYDATRAEEDVYLSDQLSECEKLIAAYRAYLLTAERRDPTIERIAKEEACGANNLSVIKTASNLALNTESSLV